jgi:ribosome-associated translation inhibitor RaiA
MVHKLPFGIKVSLTGVHEETSSTKDAVNNDIEKNMEFFSKISRINTVNIDVRRIDKGGRVNYTVRIEATGEGSYHADAEEWGLEKAMEEALERLGKELLRKKEKRKPP